MSLNDQYTSGVRPNSYIALYNRLSIPDTHSFVRLILGVALVQIFTSPISQTHRHGLNVYATLHSKVWCLFREIINASASVHVQHQIEQTHLQDCKMVTQHKMYRSVDDVGQSRRLRLSSKMIPRGERKERGKQAHADACLTTIRPLQRSSISRIMSSSSLSLESRCRCLKSVLIYCPQRHIVSKDNVVQESHTMSPFLWGRRYAALGGETLLPLPIGWIELELSIRHDNFWELGMDMDMNCKFCHDWWSINSQ